MPDLPTTHNLTTPYLRALLREAWMAGHYWGGSGELPALEQANLDVNELVVQMRPPTRYRHRETGAVYLIADRFVDHDGVERATLCRIDGFARCHVTLTELAESFEELTHG